MDVPFRRGCVVLIDDNQHLLHALRFAFEAEGYQVIALGSGEDVLKAPPRDPGTCIVIDERLPGLAGLDTMVQLRSLGVTAPAILVTSHPSRALISRAAAAGIPIVEKPLLGDALTTKVREALAG